MNKKIRSILFITIIGFVIDQIIKLIVVKYLTSVVLIPNVLGLYYAENTGVAFSMFSGGRMFIILVSILLLILLLYIANKDYIKKTKYCVMENLSYGFLFGGILGNLFDRIIRGVVIDYVGVNIFGYNFPIFNLADVLITFGVILMIINSFKKDKLA